MTRTTSAIAFAIAAASFAGAACAEKADREKNIDVAADLLTADDRNKTSTFDGNVVVTQGTMRITAARVTVKEDPQRYKVYVATGAPVTFRQKRDGTEDWIEGFAERAEFDDKSDMLKLHNKARLKSPQGELAGELITYDMGRELFQVTGAGGTKSLPGSRVKATLIPQKKGEPKGVPAAPPVTLKPDAKPGLAD